MIKKLLLSTVVLSVSTVAAFAADLPSRRAPPVYVPPPLPVFTWTGGYFGINAGYAFDSSRSFTLAGNTPGTSALVAAGRVSPYFHSNSSGFTGGGQIGYNYELGGLGGLGGGIPGIGGFGLGQAGVVFGVEADAAYTDLNNTNTGGAALATNYHARTEFVGTARGRLGLAFDNVMVYGTGGFAYGGVNSRVSVGNFTGGSDTIRTGYAYGGGVEYALPTTSFVNVFHAGAVTVKAEYLHYDLGTSSMGIVNAGGNSFTSRIHTEGNIVRAGLNYKMDFFNAPAAVVARY